MTRGLSLAAALLLGSANTAFAQDREIPTRDLPSNGGAGIRSGNITATGATVPNPGASQGAGTTSLDRGIQAEDNRLQGSICKGC